MGIAGGIIQIIVLLLPVILAVVASSNTPQAIQQDENQTLDKDIAAGRTDSINALLHDKLQNQNCGSASGQGSKI